MSVGKKKAMAIIGVGKPLSLAIVAGFVVAIAWEWTPESKLLYFLVIAACFVALTIIEYGTQNWGLFGE